MKIPVIILCIAITSCAYNGGQWASSFQTNENANLTKSKRLDKNLVSLKNCNSIVDLKSKSTSYRRNGYRLIGASVYTGNLGNEDQARGHAANIGCDKVLITRKHLGTSPETRMVLAAYTPGSLSFSTLTTSSGYSINSSSYNPGTSVYTPQIFQVDTYQNIALFFNSK